MNKTTILVRYDEIFLKGKNQGQFLRKLKANIADQLAISKKQIRVERGRLWIDPEPGQEARNLADIQRVFGVASASRSIQTEKDYDAMAEVAIEIAREELAAGARTFKIDARRADKRYPITSMQLNARLGASVLEACPEYDVDVHEPDLRIGVEVRKKAAYLYGGRTPGPGGMPVSSAGRGLSLLSSGIDSPVATWMMLKRGVSCDALYFHSFPFTGNQVLEKVIDLCRVLSEWRPGPLRLSVVSATPFQKALKEDAPESIWTVLLRRFMMRVADRLARQDGYKVLVTGEAVGQVASQTLENLTLSDSVTSSLILRPLAGFDKNEVVARARDIGTYEISIRPGDDCCTVFQPANPKTRAKARFVESVEDGLPLDTLIEEAIAEREHWEIEGERVEGPSRSTEEA